MTNKDISKIYFRGNEIVALYQGGTLIFKKKPTGVYIIKGSVSPGFTEQNIELRVNNVKEQIDINEDKTFEHTFVNVPVTNMDDFALPITGSLKTIDLSSLNTSQVTSMIRAFYGCSNLTSIDLTNVDTSNVTNMVQMFDGCKKLTSLDVSNLNTSQVTDMDNMFDYCSTLTSLDLSGFDTSKVTRMSYMFYNCSNLKSIDVSNFNTSNVTDMNSMFQGCSKLTSLDVSNFNTSNVTDMNSMFNGCSSLKSIDVSNFNTSNVTDMNGMFQSCYTNGITLLDLSNFDTSNVTDMSSMFDYGTSQSDSYSQGLTSLDVSNFNTSKVTSMYYMFASHRKLADLYINFDVRSIKDNYYHYRGIFYDCSSLKNVVGKFEGAKLDLNLSDCPLTSDSAMVFINGLATVTQTCTLSLSATTYDALTPEQIAIATAKGWTVTRV